MHNWPCTISDCHIFFRQGSVSRSAADKITGVVLLTNPGFRRHVVGAVAGDLGLGPFWAWYDNLKDGERERVIAPLMNKLRAVVLLNPFVRRTLGQSQPRFEVGQVFTQRRILLVPLPVASLGAEGSALLGSLVVGRLWEAAKARSRVPMNQRSPVPVVLDECQQFMHLSDLPDALATSRSFGVGWVLAHQYMAQLPVEVRAAVMANCRSRVVFQSTRDDAVVWARETSGKHLLEAADFMALPSYHVYCSLLEGGQVQPFASGRTLPPPPAVCDGDGLRRASARRYGRTVDEIEAGFASWAGTVGLSPVQPGADGGQADHDIGIVAAGIGRVRRTSGRSSGRVELGETKQPVRGHDGAIKDNATSPDGSGSVGGSQP